MIQTMNSPDKSARVVEARMKLKARFEEKIKNTPSVADEKPRGNGKLNKHGMPEIPVGQIVTTKWPVLDLGFQPVIPLTEWKLVVDGEIENPYTLNWQEFMAMPQLEDISDFHCVTTWSKLGMKWKGVRMLDIAAMAQPKVSATYILCYGYDGYTTNISLDEALKADVLLVHAVGGQPLPKEHGGPVRMITPQLYAWKGSKWLSRIEFLKENRLGFWEERGYSDTAYPWRNDRYS